ncbi:hypothetical protein Nstercoris_00857 [Nitrosomonas stercoris]|uniref:Uncharacterized protein n=1 Tax=Nitrosomonas stercoris TaxID=1444684 RepID=A0A4Y1YLC1_9PROT|nr:hypothetical protein Nstercoris_00857 [Nitrosomonas stercoris]
MFGFAASCQVDPIAEEAKDVAYVTRYTYTRLSGSWLQPEGRVSVDWMFDFIYEESLAAILNQPEAERLYVQKLMLERKYQSLRIKKPIFSPEYIFSVGTPKFHRTNACRCLTADFINYRVPPEIKARGPQKVREFQEFCEQLKKELEGKSDDVFWARVNARFHIHARPEQVRYENSGVQDVVSMPIAELQEKIRETVDASQEMQNGKDGAVVKNFRYAPSRKKAFAYISNPEQRKIVEQFFKLKWQLIDLLFELYRKQAGAVDYVLPLHLLQASGLEPCRKCWR